MIGISLSLVTLSGLPILIGMGIDFAIRSTTVWRRKWSSTRRHIRSLRRGRRRATIVTAAVTAVVAIRRAAYLESAHDTATSGCCWRSHHGAGGRRHRRARVCARYSRVRSGPRNVRRTSSRRSSSNWAPCRRAGAGWRTVGVAVLRRRAGGGPAEIESDPIKWVDQSSQVVKDIGQLEEETGFSSTLGVLVVANNIYDQDVIDLVWDFTLDAEERGDVVSTSSIVAPWARSSRSNGATSSPTRPTCRHRGSRCRRTSRRCCCGRADDPTGTQLNRRGRSASLEERAVLVRDSKPWSRGIDASTFLLTVCSLWDSPRGRTRCGELRRLYVGIGTPRRTCRPNGEPHVLGRLAALFLVLGAQLTRGLALALVACRWRVVADRRVVGRRAEPLSQSVAVVYREPACSCAHRVTSRNDSASIPRWLPSTPRYEPTVLLYLRGRHDPVAPRRRSASALPPPRVSASS